MFSFYELLGIDYWRSDLTIRMWEGDHLPYMITFGGFGTLALFVTPIVLLVRARTKTYRRGKEE